MPGTLISAKMLDTYLRRESKDGSQYERSRFGVAVSLGNDIEAQISVIEAVYTHRKMVAYEEPFRVRCVVLS